MNQIKPAREFFELARKLDEIIDVIRRETKARAAVVLVMDADGGMHFTVQGNRTIVSDIPRLLLQMAESIYDDIERDAGKTRH